MPNVTRPNFLDMARAWLVRGAANVKRTNAFIRATSALADPCPTSPPDSDPGGRIIS